MRYAFLKHQGFTLIEILIVVAIIGILAAVMTANYSETSANSRDSKRQSDLSNLQVAIEAYKNRFGKYPDGCKGAGQWSGQVGTDFACLSGGQYIVGLAPDFISVLPIDPKLPSGRTDVGYVYTVNGDGTVYKIMAMNTVENDPLIGSGEYKAYTSPYKSCDMKPAINQLGEVASEIPGYSLCYQISTNGSNINDAPEQCRMYNSRFKSSYALWGGFADLANGVTDITYPLDTTMWKAIYKTSAIICK